MKDKSINFRVLFYPFLAFMFGIIVARPIFSGDIEVIVVSAVTLCIAVGYFLFHKSFRPAIFILIFFLIGNGFFFIGQKSFDVKSYTGKVAVVGRVSDDIVHYDYNCLVVLDDVKIDGDDCKNLRLTINNPDKNKIKAGVVMTFEADIETVKAFTLKSFNSKDYRSGVRYTSSVKFENIVLSDGNRKLDEIIRSEIKSLIYSNMSEDNAGIAYAVMFGDKSDLDGEIYSAYQNSGIIHVLTVSGLHVGFLVSLFYGLLRKCRVNNVVNLIITSFVIFAYAFLCNFSPSVVRAGVMAICMMLARASHRRYDSLNALGLAGFILCIFKPLTALDTGFLMSFFCVFAIVMINPSLSRVLSKFIPYRIASLISLSLSAQVGILPMLAGMGGTLNLLSFVVNIIVVPMFSVLYPFLFVVCMLGSFMPFMGIFLHAVNFVLMIINKLATFFGYSSLNIPLSSLGFSVTIILFLLLFLLSRYFMVDNMKKFVFFTCSVFVMSLVTCCYSLPLSNLDTSISYIGEYGQSCVVLSSKSGQTAVIGESGMLSRYQNAYKTDLDAYFSFSSISGDDVSSLSDKGIVKFITCSPYSDKSEGSDIVEVNTLYNLSGMDFVYVTSSDEVLGILFIVDNRTIFVAKDGNLGYNLYETAFEKYSPEVVIGSNSNLAQGEYICLTYDHEKEGEFSYQKDGNFKLFYNGKTWLKRGLD